MHTYESDNQIYKMEIFIPTDILIKRGISRRNKMSLCRSKPVFICYILLD